MGRAGLANDRPNRVCLYTESDAFGGAEQMLLDLVAHLDPARWKPMLLYRPGPGIEQFASSMRARGAELAAVPALNEGLGGARQLPRFVRMLRALRPAVFHAQLTWPMEAKFALMGALSCRIPAVCARVCAFPEFRSTIAARLQRQAIICRIGAVSAVSEHVALELTTALGWPASKIRVVRSGVDAGEFDIPADPTLRRELASGTERKIVLAAARLDPAKGLATLIDAARSVPGAQIVIAGEGPQRQELEARAAEVGVAGRVTFLGHRSDVARLLACSDVFAMPSLNEGLGYAVLEAMAASLPVVASAVGGLTESVLPGETGLLVPPGDAKALGGALQELLADHGLAQRMGAAGRQRVRAHFTAEGTARSVSAMWAELLASRKHTS